MIIGQFNHNLDTKNRLMIPAKIRANINTSVVITLSVDGCLEVRTLDEFNIFTEKFTNIDSSSERERIISRWIFANSQMVDIDSANRILIPNNLSNKANIKNETLIIGLKHKIEVWNPAIFNEKQQDAELNIKNLFNKDE